MSKEKFEKEISGKLGDSIGVQSLSDRPNKTSAYGEGGFSATQLKEKFDQYADTLAEAVSELQTKLNGDEAAGEYIGISLENGPNKLESLYDLIEAIQSGGLADNFLKVTPYPDASPTTISSAFGSVSQEISNIKEKIDSIKVDLTVTEDYKLEVSVTENDVVIYTSESIDLPIETLFKSATYDSDNKKLIFTTETGTVEVGISDIVSGLVTTDQLNAAVSVEKIKAAVTELFGGFAEDEEY